MGSTFVGSKFHSGYSGFSGAFSSEISGFSGYTGLLEDVELKDIGEAVVSLGDVSGTADLNIHNGNVATATATGDTTWTFSNPFPAGMSCTVSLILTNGGSWIQTWPTTTLWPGGIPPSLSPSGVDMLIFTTIDGGTTWLGVLSGANFS